MDFFGTSQNQQNNRQNQSRQQQQNQSQQQQSTSSGFNFIDFSLNEQSSPSTSNNRNKNKNKNNKVENRGFLNTMTNTIGFTSPPTSNNNKNKVNQQQNQQQNQQPENRGIFGTMTNAIGITSPPTNLPQNQQSLQLNQQQINTSENAVNLTNKNLQNITKNLQNEQIIEKPKEQQEERGFFNTITNAVGITEKPKEQKNTSSIYRSINTTKKHYFIGYMVNNEKQIQDLIQIQNKLITRYKMRKFYKNWDQKFVSRFVYMGYLTPEVAQKYMEKLMKDLCIQISNKFTSLVCKYKKIMPKFDKSVNWISISYDDEKEYLSKIIIPFLDKYGIKPIFPNRKTLSIPMIDIIHFKQSSLGKKDVIDLSIPNSTFTIDHLSLLSGKPTQTKIGGQSIHDRLAYEEEGKYYFPFKV
jgi:hypothetical protein